MIKFIGTIILLYFTLIPQFKVEDNFEKECQEVIQFLSNNRNIFIDEFNKEYEKEGKKIEVDYFEYFIPIIILDENTRGVYIDFNNENGYMVMSLDFNIFRIETEGDLKYLKKEKFAYFSSIDGFLFLTNHGYEKYDKNFKNMTFTDREPYAGQSAEGDGEIYDIKAYVSNRYPSYSYVSSQNTIANEGFNYINQRATSYYLKYVSSNGGQTYPNRESEANCSLTAMYLVMNSWQKRSIISELPSISEKMDVYETISQDIFYSEYGKDESSSIKEGDFYTYWAINSENTLRNMKKLYVDIRDCAAKKFGYTPRQGLNVSNVPYIMESVASKYGKNISISKTTNFSTIQMSIDNGRAVYLSISGSSTYGNHGVSLIGYEKYSYKTGWWIFQSTNYAYFFAIGDGRNISLQYFDPNTSANPSLTYCYFE